MEYDTGQRHVWRSTVCLKLLIDWSSDAATNADGKCHVGIGRGEGGRPPKDEKIPQVAGGNGCTWMFESSKGARRTLGR